MEQFVTRPHYDTQSEDTVGINPYTLLSVQLTHHRLLQENEGRSIGHSGVCQSTQVLLKPCYQLSAILITSPQPPYHTGLAIFN